MNQSKNDLFQGIRNYIDFRPDAKDEYEARVASKGLVLDIGGRNHASRSYQRLKSLSTNPDTKIISTDVIEDYGPDIVDDICDSRLESEGYDGVNCVAILEHVQDYEAAVGHIHRILKPGGEVFFYVPFVWGFHDTTDYHRFTFTEIDRILQRFSQHKILLADGNGYGGVIWLVLTFFQIAKFPRLWYWLSKASNLALAIPLTLSYLYTSVRKGRPNESLAEYIFYYSQLFLCHGLCGWARK